MISKVFGDWTVVSTPFKKGKRYYAQCVCICGNKKDVLAQNLKKGTSTNCGCSKPIRMGKLIEVNINNKKRVPRSFSGLKKVFNLYKLGAKKRGLVWDLSIETFKEITQKNCVYCNASPSKVSKCKSKRASKESIERSSYYYNGIDRVNSSLGYLESNCVTCCWICNRMKSDLSKESFIEKIKSIYNVIVGNK